MDDQDPPKLDGRKRSRPEDAQDIASARQTQEMRRQRHAPEQRHLLSREQGQGQQGNVVDTILQIMRLRSQNGEWQCPA